MGNQISKLWYMPLFKGIIMILLAILIYMSPGGTLLAWALYVGMGVVIAGVLLIYQGLTLRSADQNWRWKVFEGILDIFLGFMLMANPVITAAVIPVVIGFWGAMTGILLFVGGIAGKEGKAIRLLFGILIFILATFIMFNPVSAALTTVVWIAILLLLSGTTNLLLAFRVRSLRK